MISSTLGASFAFPTVVAYSSPQALRPSAAAPAAPVCSARRRVKRGPRAIVLLLTRRAGHGGVGERGRRDGPGPYRPSPHDAVAGGAPAGAAYSQCRRVFSL